MILSSDRLEPYETVVLDKHRAISFIEEILARLLCAVDMSGWALDQHTNSYSLDEALRSFCARFTHTAVREPTQALSASDRRDKR